MLFTDIEGSTRLLKRFGAGYGELLAEHQRILRDAAEGCGGREVDTQGDSFFFAFARANSALAAAAIAQRELAEHQWPDGGRVRVRMGLHTGEPAVGEERYVGLGVNRAARIGAVAHGGQVLLSNATRELVVDEVGGVSVRELGAYRLKDFDRPEPLFQLDVEGLETEFPPLKAEKYSEPHPVRRRVLLAGVAAAAIAGVIAAGIALTSRGGSASTVLPNSVVRIDPETLKVTQVARVGDAPDLVLASGGYLWITNNILRDTNSGAIRSGGDHTLTRVNPSTGEAVVVGGGIAPCGLAADPSGDVWVANCFASGSGQTSNIVRVDATTLAFKEALPVPGGQGYFRGLTYGGGSLWVSNVPALGSSTNVFTITQVDPRTRRERTIRVPGRPGGLDWSDGYGDLWISHFDDGSMTRLHPATGTSQTIGSVGINPTVPVVDGSVVWIGDWSAPQVVRLNATGPPRPHLVPLPVRNVRCGNVSCVWRVAAGAGAVWATTPRDHALWRIDPKTNGVTRVSLPYPPTGVTADANNVWVTVR
jgi:class 3 adenylate cyclase/streptogramin lyase